MKQNEIDRLARLCDMLREVKVVPGAVSEDPQSMSHEIVLNVVVSVVVKMDEELYRQFATSTKQQASDRSKEYLGDLFQEVAELVQRMVSSHNAAQLVIESVAKGEHDGQ